MEQMDLEVREIPIQSRGMYRSRLKSYKGEMEKLEKDFVSTPPYCNTSFILVYSYAYTQSIRVHNALWYP
jgi:hypothetical protein